MCEITRTNFQKRSNFLLLFEYGRSKLACLGGYPTHRDVADMSDLFYCHFEFIWSRGVTRLPRSCLSKWNGLNKNWYKHSSLARRKLYKCVYINLNFLCTNLNFLILSHQPAKLGLHRPCEGGDMTSFICHVTTISKCHVTLWMEYLILSHYPAKFGVHRPCESGAIRSLICHVTTWSMCRVTLWVGFSHPKSLPC